MITAIGLALTPTIIKLVEKAVGGKDGSFKKELAVDLTKTALKQLFKKKKIPAMPSDEEIAASIETQVQELNKQRVLVGEETVIDGDMRQVFSGISQVLAGTAEIFDKLSVTPTE